MARTLKQLSRQFKIDSDTFERHAKKLGIDLRYGVNTEIGEFDQKRLLAAAGIEVQAQTTADNENGEKESGNTLLFSEIVFGEDKIPSEVPSFRPDSPFNVFYHEDILEDMDDRKSDTAIIRRTSLVVRHLIAHGRTSIQKGTKNNENRGWRRTPLGGHGGNHYYLWWAPYGATPVKQFNETENAIYVRQIRHHDNHETLTAGDFGEYMPLTVPDLTKADVFTEPWTPPQIQFCSDTGGIRLLNGSPGSGKTTALWNAVNTRSGERVLYVTWSQRLVVEAKEHFDAFAPVDSTIIPRPFDELVRSFQNSEEIARYGQRDQQRKIFIESLGRMNPSIVGSWRGHEPSLFGELRSFMVGSALPDDPARLEDVHRPRLKDNAYFEDRKNDLGETEAKATTALVKALENEQPVENFFPDLCRAFHAVRALRNGVDLPEDLSHFDRIVVDEIQDLTPVEVLVLVYLTRRLADSHPQRRAPFLLFAGDPAQTVRPTGFKWGTFRNLIRSRLGADASETELNENVRSPIRISQMVNEASTLYEHVPRSARPKGSVLKTAINESTNDQIYQCVTSNGPAVKDLLASLAEDADIALIHLDDDPPSYLDEEIVGNVRTPEEVKGRDFQKVCVLNAGSYLRRIRAEVTAGGRSVKVVPIWKRTAVDRFRVALSRATETIVFLDIDATEEDRAELNDFIQDIDPVPVEPEDIIDYLAEQDIEERVAGCIRDASGSLDLNPSLAWRRALQAVRLLGDRRKPNSVKDNSIRQEALLTCARVAMMIQNDLPRALSESDVLLSGANAAKKAERPDIEKLLRFLAGLPKLPSALRFTELKGLLDALAGIKKKENWIDVSLRTRSVKWKRDLDACLDSLTEKDLLPTCKQLLRYYEALQVESASREAQNTLRQLSDRLFAAKRFQTTLDILPMLDVAPQPVQARCLSELGRFKEAAPLFERSNEWSEGLRCYREIMDLPGALRCASRLTDSADAQLVRWFDRYRQVLEEKPPLPELNKEEIAWLWQALANKAPKPIKGSEQLSKKKNPAGHKTASLSSQNSNQSTSSEKAKSHA